ncbi:MAG: ABC transporter permease subunit [Candidatus Marinimicrobia bacterium]|nr:ABC transporter permease subunit [Candidatus Neomarinimicrobiota bacterium]
MKLGKTTSFEIYKIFSKWRTYIGFVAIAILIPLIMVLVKEAGFSLQNNALSNLKESFLFYGSPVNGYLISYYLLTAFWFYFPFFVILVAGDIVSIEKSTATIRMYLSRPVSRLDIYTLCS